jgi:hypothetical protein
MFFFAYIRLIMGSKRSNMTSNRLSAACGERLWRGRISGGIRGEMAPGSGGVTKKMPGAESTGRAWIFYYLTQVADNILRSVKN